MNIIKQTSIIHRLTSGFLVTTDNDREVTRHGYRHVDTFEMLKESFQSEMLRNLLLDLGENKEIKITIIIER